MIVLKVKNLLRRKREKVLEQRLLIFQKKKKKKFLKIKHLKLIKLKTHPPKKKKKETGGGINSFYLSNQLIFAFQFLRLLFRTKMIVL